MTTVLAPQTTKYVTAYLRISVDDADSGEGVDNQRAWFEAWAAEHYPGQPTRVFCDNDVTGSKADREDFERLREAIARGEVAQLWVRDQARLQRDKIIWFTLQIELVKAGVEYLHTKKRGTVKVDDLVTDIEAVVDARRREEDRQNLMDRQAQDARKGYPPSGTIYGYRPAKTTTDDGRTVRTLEIVPEQAEVIRWCAGQILAGRSATSLARELKAKGTTGARGQATVYTSNQVEQWVTSATVAGWRRFRGEILTDDQGNRVSGNWPAILDVETWEDVCAVIERRKAANRATSAKGGAERRRYVLSGLATCSRCDAPMRGQRKRQSAGRPHALLYKCAACGTTIDMATVDAVALDAVGARLAESSELAEALTVDDSADRRDAIHRALEGIHAKRTEARQDRVDDLISRDDHRDTLVRLKAREDALQAELAELVVPGSDVDPAAALHALGEARQAAAEGDVEAIATLRALAGEWLSAVLVAPAVRGQDPRSRLTVR